jgi:hypothetical protein
MAYSQEFRSMREKNCGFMEFTELSAGSSESKGEKR